MPRSSTREFAKRPKPSISHQSGERRIRVGIRGYPPLMREIGKDGGFAARMISGFHPSAQVTSVFSGYLARGWIGERAHVVHAVCLRGAGLAMRGVSHAHAVDDEADARLPMSGDARRAGPGYTENKTTPSHHPTGLSPVLARPKA